MEVKFVSRGSTDLTSVNAARVSFGKSKNKFDKRDAGLLDFLSREVHFTPFTHIRVTFSMKPMKMLFARMDETDMAGMVKEHTTGNVKVRHSIYGWANLIRKGLVREDAAEQIAHTLHKLYPENSKALKVPAGLPSTDVVHEADENETDLRFIDVTLHVKAPIFIARQEFKHIVAFTRNEISRRYVDSAPEFMRMEWRERPDKSIKQGSGAIVRGWRKWVSTALSVTVNAVAKTAYQMLLGMGIAPEQARSVLPQSMYTEYHLTGSITAFQRLAGLRMDANAQVEIQGLAMQMWREINTGIPVRCLNGIKNEIES